MEQRLRNILYGNTSFSLISSLACIFMAKSIANTMGIQSSQEILFIGIGVLLFAGYVLFVAKQNPLKKGLVKSVIAMDFFWVLGSLLIIALNPFALSNAGILIITIVALFVLIFGTLQTITLKKI